LIEREREGGRETERERERSCATRGAKGEKREGGRGGGKHIGIEVAREYISFTHT
jgi:hypothetical protein